MEGRAADVADENINNPTSKEGASFGRLTVADVVHYRPFVSS
jgi:hypothetical protein